MANLWCRRPAILALASALLAAAALALLVPRDLDHPDHPLGGDDLLAARAQLRFILGARTDVLLSGDAADQDGPLLTFNKALAVKPGFTIDNPADLHEVRTSSDLHSALGTMSRS